MSAEVVVKAFVYGAALQAIGAAAAFWLLEREPALDRSIGGAVARAIRRIGMRASGVLVLALLGRAWAHTAATFGVAQSATWNALSTVALESRWGRGWQIQLLAATACFVVYALTDRSRAQRLALPTLAGAALAVALTKTGHAAGAPTRMAIHTAHVIGAGVWLGTLTTLIALRATLEPAMRHAMFQRFARMALAGAAVLVAAGLAATWWYVGSFGNLWTTVYGRVLLIKIALVGGVVACGYRNWRAIGSGRIEPGRAAIVELWLAGAVVVATSLLTEIEHP